MTFRVVASDKLRGGRRKQLDSELIVTELTIFKVHKNGKAQQKQDEPGQVEVKSKSEHSWIIAPGFFRCPDARTIKLTQTVRIRLKKQKDISPINLSF